MSFMQSKVFLAVLGVVIITVVTTAVVIATTPHSGTGNAPLAAVATATPTVVSAATAAVTATVTDVAPTATVAATDTPSARPTATPRATTTVGQQVDWHDRVSSVNTFSSTFRLRNRGVTVVVNSQTTYAGVASSLSQMRSGMLVEVQGVIQGDGSVLASQVSTQLND
jgi:heme/copper-type cytochrome/quinol oxidase subunit 2